MSNQYLYGSCTISFLQNNMYHLIFNSLFLFLSISLQITSTTIGEVVLNMLNKVCRCLVAQITQSLINLKVLFFITMFA